MQPAAFGIEQVPAETVGSTLALRGTLDALDLTGRVELKGGEADGVAADISARYAGGAAEIHALDVVDAGSRAAVHASGRVALGAEQQPVLELAATWTELQWPLRGAPQVASDSGSLELRGTLREYAVALDGNLALADGTNGKVSVSGNGQRGGAEPRPRRRRSAPRPHRRPYERALGAEPVGCDRGDGDRSRSRRGSSRMAGTGRRARARRSRRSKAKASPSRCTSSRPRASCATVRSSSAPVAATRPTRCGSMRSRCDRERRTRVRAARPAASSRSNGSCRART